MGNAGQCDYAYANSFLDNFAAWRGNLDSMIIDSGLESDEEARKICSEYWVLVFKKKPVTTAELKPGRRRRMRKRAADEIKSYE